MNARLFAKLVSRFALTMLLSLQGCAEPSPSVENEPIEEHAQEQTNEPLADQRTQAEQQSTDEKSAEDKPAVEKQDDKHGDKQDDKQEEPVPSASYRAPFPDRTDLFAAPKRQGTRRVTSDGNASHTVELVGFINVGQPRAVLSINGLETPIAEGGSREGIEVISIQEKSVVLQRGRQRWQATLQN